MAETARILGVGIDLVEVERIARAIHARGATFLARIFTSAEREYCGSCASPAPHYAARFAAKEAVLKVLGTGWTGGLGFAEVEVHRDEDGRPSVILHGRAREVADARGIDRIHLSLSHTDALAIAYAVGEGSSTTPS